MARQRGRDPAEDRQPGVGHDLARVDRAVGRREVDDAQWRVHQRAGVGNRTRQLPRRLPHGVGEHQEHVIDIGVA